MEYFIVFTIFGLIFLLTYLLKNQRIKNNSNLIEKIINIISIYLYDKDILFNEIKYLGLKCEYRSWKNYKNIHENEEIIFFYDKINREFNLKEKHWFSNPYLCIKTIFIEFNFENNNIKWIRIFFNNLEEYIFGSDYVNNKFSELKNNNIVYLENNSLKIPYISYILKNEITIGY